MRERYTDNSIGRFLVRVGHMERHMQALALQKDNVAPTNQTF